MEALNIWCIMYSDRAKDVKLQLFSWQLKFHTNDTVKS